MQINIEDKVYIFDFTDNELIYKFADKNIFEAKKWVLKQIENMIDNEINNQIHKYNNIKNIE